MSVTGVDLSHYNPEPPTATLDFVILKATQGTTFIDPTYAGRAAWAIDNNLVLGAYHFLTTTDPVTAQVDHFASVLDGVSDYPTFLALDVEDDGTWRDLTPQAIASLVANWLHVATVNSALPRIPILVYCDATTWNTIISTLSPSSYAGLWLADPDNAHPTIPRLLTQTFTSSIGGVPGSWDLDTFATFTTRTDLNAWLRSYDMPATIIPLTVDMANRRAYAVLEIGTNSVLFTQAWVAIKPLFGSITGLDAEISNDINGCAHLDLNNCVGGILDVNVRAWQPLPPGTSSVVFTWTSTTPGTDIAGYVALQG